MNNVMLERIVSTYGKSFNSRQKEPYAKSIFDSPAVRQFKPWYDTNSVRKRLKANDGAFNEAQQVFECFPNLKKQTEGLRLLQLWRSHYILFPSYPRHFTPLHFRTVDTPLSYCPNPIKQMELISG